MLLTRSFLILVSLLVNLAFDIFYLTTSTQTFQSVTDLPCSQSICSYFQLLIISDSYSLFSRSELLMESEARSAESSEARSAESQSDVAPKTRAGGCESRSGFIYISNLTERSLLRFDIPGDVTSHQFPNTRTSSLGGHFFEIGGKISNRKFILPLVYSC